MYTLTASFPGSFCILNLPGNEANNLDQYPINCVEEGNTENMEGLGTVYVCVSIPAPVSLCV